MKTKALVSAISATVITAGVIAGVIFTSGLRPQPPQAPDTTGRPNVVRVSVVQGSVVVQRGDSGVQTNAVRNAPMLAGDYISTGKTSRAELQFDGYTAVRLGGDVQARIVNDGARSEKLQLAEGTIEIGMVRHGQAMEVDTPSITVVARESGDFRISIAGDGSSWVTARRGSVDVITPQHTNTLGSGNTIVARGAATDPSIAYSPAVAFDSFDDFNAQRDKAMVAALGASPNLNPSIAGYENLGSYGHWQAIAGYGQSWVPDEPASWVPYRNGSWAWERGYGWTWIGSEPWGWTPYHYGNWYYCSCGSSGWAWLPPSSAKTPSWAPALVGFFGFDVASTGGANNCGGNYGYAPASYNAPEASGNGAPYSASAPEAPSNAAAPAAAPYGEGGPTPYGEGGPGPSGYPAAPYGEGSPGYSAPYAYPYPYIGWVPIAPYEPYYPWYFGFGGYGYPGAFATRIVNITNITNVTRIYRNFRHGGATATSVRNFRHGTVSGHTVAVNRRDIGHRFGSVHGALPIRPTRNNLGFTHGTVHAPVKFSKVFNTPRFSSHGMVAARNDSARGRPTSTRPSRANESMHATTRTAVGRANAPVSRENSRVGREYAPIARTNAPETRQRGFQAHSNPEITRGNQAPTRGSGSEAFTRGNDAMTRGDAVTSRQTERNRGGYAPVTRENAPVSREHSAPAMREDSVAPRRAEAPRTDFAPATSWDRFNSTRGDARGAAFSSGSAGATSARDGREGAMSAPSDAGRQERAPTDSWGRFSTSRGDSSEGMRNPYGERESMQSNQREPPSYSRGSYGSPYSRDSYPSYSRGSYGSPYSHESYPSYSRGSYPSYSRGSYPSYSRGSYGSAPSRGYSAPPHASSGGGGGGGGERHGGARPPH